MPLIRRALLALLVIISISALLIYLQNRVGLENIRQVVLKAGVWGPIVYIFLQLLTHIVAPLQGSPFFLMAIAVFGKSTVIYTYIVSVISGFTNFWIARKLGRDIVIKFVTRDGMKKIDHIATTQEGVKALIIIRFFQGYISDFVSYAVGLTSMKFKTYYLNKRTRPFALDNWLVFIFQQNSSGKGLFLGLNYRWNSIYYSTNLLLSKTQSC